jgi:hypothetical protein
MIFNIENMKNLEGCVFKILKLLIFGTNSGRYFYP